MKQNQNVIDAPIPRGHFALAVNMIANGKFYHAGVPMPLAELAAIPPNLRKREFIIRHSNLEPEPDDAPRSLTFQLNTAYAVDEDGNRRQARHLQRQAAQLEAIEDQESAIVEELQNANDDLDPAIAAQIQDAHDSLVQRQIAEGQAAARQCEIDEEAARQFIASRIRCWLTTFLRRLSTMSRSLNRQHLSRASCASDISGVAIPGFERCELAVASGKRFTSEKLKANFCRLELLAAMASCQLPI